MLKGDADYELTVQDLLFPMTQSPRIVLALQYGRCAEVGMRGIQDNLRALICVSISVKFKPPCSNVFITEFLVTLSGPFHKNL